MHKSKLPMLEMEVSKSRWTHLSVACAGAGTTTLGEKHRHPPALLNRDAGAGTSFPSDQDTFLLFSLGDVSSPAQGTESGEALSGPCCRPHALTGRAHLSISDCRDGQILGRKRTRKDTLLLLNPGAP